MSQLHVIQCYHVQVSGLHMSVDCDMVSNMEAVKSVLEIQSNLEDISKTFGCEHNSDLATLYLEAKQSLEDLKRQIKLKSQDEVFNNGKKF